MSASATRLTNPRGETSRPAAAEVLAFQTLQPCRRAGRFCRDRTFPIGRTARRAVLDTS